MVRQFRFRLLLLMLCCTAGSQNVISQDDEKPKKPAAIVYVSFQLVKTDGTNILIEQDLPDPKKKATPQLYTVKVPVRKTVIKDGKPSFITEYVTQTRTRMIRPTIRKSVPLLDNQEFRDSEGKVIPMEKMIGRLGMGSGRYVVQVNPGLEMPAELIRTFSKDTIFLHYKNAEKKTIEK